VTFWDKLSRWRPCHIRLLAQRSGAPISSEVIAQRMGTTPYQVDHISLMTDWSGMDMETARKFIQACECDFENAAVHNRMRTFIAWQGQQPNLRRWRALRRDVRWASFWRPLIERARTVHVKE
jgi:hypothetical protein